MHDSHKIVQNQVNLTSYFMIAISLQKFIKFLSYNKATYSFYSKLMNMCVVALKKLKFLAVKLKELLKVTLQALQLCFENWFSVMCV